MTVDAVSRYLEAKAAYEAARAAAQSLVDKFVSVASKLQGWDRVMFANVSAGGFPPELMNAPSVDARQIPSIDQIAQLASQFHHAKVALRNAWYGVPENLRGGLLPPAKDVIE